MPLPTAVRRGAAPARASGSRRHAAAALALLTYASVSRPLFAQGGASGGAAGGAAVGPVGPAPGHNQDAEACFEAAEAAQPLLRQSRLRAARLQLDICVRDACPRVVRSDCTAWMQTLETNTPSVVLSAVDLRDEKRTPIDRARVLVDGEVLVAAHLDADPHAVDPGTHVFRFERTGYAAVEVRATVAAGTKRQKVEAVFTPSLASSGEGVTAGGPGEGKGPSRGQEQAHDLDWLAYALGGTGVASLGVGAYFEASGLGARGNLSACRGSQSCDPSDVDSARSRVLVGDILLGAGILLVGSGVVVLLTQRSGAPANPPPRISFGVAPLPGGVAAGVGGAL